MTPEGNIAGLSDTGSAEPTPVATAPEPAPEPSLDQSLESFFAERAPAPDPASEPQPQPPAEAGSIFAGLFEVAALGDNNQKLERGAQVIQALQSYDPIAYETMLNSFYEQAAPVYTAWLLEDLGVPRERAQEFIEWAKSGAGALPEALPQYSPFPEPDEENFVTLPNGLQLDLDDPVHKQHYEAVRALYERDIEQKKAEAEYARATEQHLAEQIGERRTAFKGERIAAIGRTLDALNLQFAEEDSWMERMLIRDILGEIDELEELEKLGDEALPYVDAGSGRAAEYARKIDAIIAAKTREVADRFTRRIPRANRAERTLMSKAPVLPSGTRRVDVTSTPSRAEDQNFKPQSYREIERRRMRELDDDLSRAFAG